MTELKKMKPDPKVEFIENANVKEIGGEDFVEYIVLEGSKTEKVNVDGVFIILEQVPTSSILKEAGVKTDDGGCILVDMEQETNMDGVFAAGDCSCKGMQVVTATGMGAKAALSAMKYVKKLKG